MAFGTFDKIHPGHIFCLTEAKKLGDYLMVVVGRSITVAELKKHHPQTSEQERLAGVKKLGIADEVLLGSLEDKYSIINKEKPDIIALGYDQTFFTEQLKDHIPSATRIIRLPALKPDVYKSSKLTSLHG